MIRRRYKLLGALNIIGAVLFLPFYVYSAGEVLLRDAVLFVAASSSLSCLALWPGLRLADATGLRMPFLRAFEESNQMPAVNRSGLITSLFAATVVGTLAVVVQRWLGLETPPVPAWARVLSAPFAAITLEVVLHLFGMSLLLKLASGRAWVAIVGSGLLLGLFHLGGGGAIGSVVIVVIANSVGGVVFGWLFWAFGFEYLVLSHAVGHVLALLLT